jgi:hypothetical protein
MDLLYDVFHMRQLFTVSHTINLSPRLDARVRTWQLVTRRNFSEGRWNKKV